MVTLYDLHAVHNHKEVTDLDESSTPGHDVAISMVVSDWSIFVVISSYIIIWN